MITRFLLTALITAFTASGSPTFAKERATHEPASGEEAFLSSGDRFAFTSNNGRINLNGILFRHPGSKGLIVVVNGRSESWLKYGELFRDLYRRGFSIASYDHRGQGLSPRLFRGNPQIGWVDGFSRYSDDLFSFLLTLRKHFSFPPDRCYLLAHSMGAVVSMEFLSKHPGAFRAAAFTSPMFRINTSPWPEPLAALVLNALRATGRGKTYAPGEHDHDPDASFRSNRVTGSPQRWEMMLRVNKEHPESTVGGASVDWVAEAMEATREARGRLPFIRTPILILQAGRDALVVNQPPPRNTVVQSSYFPEARHEILMESDPIRDEALRQIIGFYTASTSAPPLGSADPP